MKQDYTKPPYRITPGVIELIASISEMIGKVDSSILAKPGAELRKRNRIRTIQSSCAIEGNSLTLEEVTAIRNNKRVIAPSKDILEVKNAIAVYDRLDSFNPLSIHSFLQAHNILMNGLVSKPGEFRTVSAGVFKGSVPVHIAPPAQMVRSHMNNLFRYLKADKDFPLIKSCVFHYETEFVHPFLDGNGRMGRLWQTMLLSQYSQIFEFLPVETLIKAKQSEYYKVLDESDKLGDSTVFLEFMLQVINESLEELLDEQTGKLTVEDRIEIYRTGIGNEPFSRKDYMKHFRDISSATASRYLKWAVGRGILEKTGDKRTTRYRFVK
jgi:Fic family protein